jgi:hypothetical protein
VTASSAIIFEGIWVIEEEGIEDGVKKVRDGSRT